MKKMLVLIALVLLLSACGQPIRKSAEVPDSPAPTDAAPPDTADPAPVEIADVENNGGFFVQLDGKVFFRKYGPEALDQTALFGEFLDPWRATGWESEIVSYDLTTRRVETVFTDTGYGALFYGDGGFYLQERAGGADMVVWYSLDGTQSRTIAPGSILGITDSGLLAVQRSGISGGDGSSQEGFFFYRHGEAIGSFLSPDFLSFAGLSDDGLFLIREEDSAEDDQLPVRTLWQLPPEGEGQVPASISADGSSVSTDRAAICLGRLPDADWIVSAEPGQFVTTENQIGIMIGYYAGTGHFLNDCAAVTAIPGAADSLTVLEAAGAWGEGEAGLPKLMVNENGEITVTDHLPGELEIGWKDGEEGDLRLYDGFGWETLKRGLCPPRVDGSGYDKIVQSMEYLDGAAYVTLAVVYASPLDDIGWRSAYTLLDMLYLVIPAAQGEERELACVDHGAVLQGNVWFLEDASALLWQQNTFDPDAYDTEAPGAYQIPIAEDAEWYALDVEDADHSDRQSNGMPLYRSGRESILANAVYTQITEEGGYYGYSVPEEWGQFLCFRLNRDGEIEFLTEKSPDALLTIEIGVSEADLEGAADKLDLQPRLSDEDIPWYWTRLTALEDGVSVRIERTAPDQSIAEEIAAQEGMFIPGETLFHRTLNRGERIGLRASLPWYPEIRVSATRGGSGGSYVFGEDNYEHYAAPEDGTVREMTLAGYPMADADPLAGKWLYRDGIPGERHSAVLAFDGEDTVSVETAEQGYLLSYHMDHLFAREWEAADLLCLEAEAPETIAALNGMEGSAGDYWIQRFQTDGETILYLIQANNGDGALDLLIPSQKQWNTELVLHRYEGAAKSAPPPRNMILDGLIVKAEMDGIWIQAVEQAGEREDGSPIYRASPDISCLYCPLESPAVLSALENYADSQYPMKPFQITTNQDGEVTSIREIDFG